VKKKRTSKKPAPSGPEAERLKLIGDWKQNVGVALAKKPPKGGWPKA